MMEQQKENKKKTFAWTYIETIFCVVAVLTLFIPLLLTQNWGLPSFTKTGDIGDTIGGTTAPFIGLLSAWLVYKALKAQIEANEQINKQFEDQKRSEQANKIVSTLTDQIRILREDIKDFRFSTVTKSTGQYRTLDYQGPEGIQAALDYYPLEHVEERYIVMRNETAILQIIYFLESMEYIFQTVEKSDIAEMDRHYFNKLVKEVFLTKFLFPIHENEYKIIHQQDKCKECGEPHGIMADVFTIANRISERCS